MLPYTTTQTILPECHTRWCNIRWSIMTHHIILWSRRNWSYIVQCLFFSLLVEDYFWWGKILVQFSDRMYPFSLQSKYMLLMYLFLYESVSHRLKKKTLTRNPNSFFDFWKSTRKANIFRDSRLLDKTISVIYPTEKSTFTLDVWLIVMTIKYMYCRSMNETSG